MEHLRLSLSHPENTVTPLKSDDPHWVALSTSDSNNYSSEVKGLSNALMVALSTCDTGKWFTLQKWRDSTPQTARDQHQSAFNYECSALNGQESNRMTGLRQYQKRLTQRDVARLSQRYDQGATIYELATEFGIDRHTVSERLKKAGTTMRGHSPTPST